MKNVLSLGILLLTTTFATAGTTTCSSSDQRVSYVHSLPDQGIMPPHPPEATVILVLDKKVLIQKHAFDKKTGKPLPSFENAKFDVVKAVNVENEDLEPVASATIIGYQLQKATVTGKDGKALYEGVLFCRSFTALVP
jgi:hypothetical protein